MSGILYVVMAILVATLTVAIKRANRFWAKAYVTATREGRLKASQDLATFKMHLDAKDQQIADIRRDTEDEMRRLFKDLVDSLHSEIDELCEEKSKLIRTVNLQGAQLEKLDEKSELSRISINGVPLTRRQLDDELESGLQAEYPSVWLYGDHELASLDSWDHLYEREVLSDKTGLQRGERDLYKRKDNTRQPSYRQASIDMRKARRMVETPDDLS